MTSSLQNKVAIVTGSSRGIGAAIAIGLAAEGASVVVNYVSASSKVHAEATADSIKSHGSKALIVQADLGSLEDIDRLVEETVKAFGKIDILVNNSGLTNFEPIGKITPDAYRSTFDVNVRAIIFLSQAVLPFMGDGGRIINLSSTAARQGSQFSTVYSASKAAVEAITRTMGVGLRDKGIRVTAINPGPTLTLGFREAAPPGALEIVKASGVPMAAPEDIADVAVFLAGEKGRWINGVTVGTNNGVVLN